MKLAQALILILTTGILATSCASMKDKQDKTRTNSIKTVAVIGFELLQKQPKDPLAIGSINALNEQGLLQNTPQMKELALKSYQNLIDSLAAKTGWKVLSLQELQKNIAFNSDVQNAMSGMRLATGGIEYEAFLPAGVYGHQNVLQMKEQERSKIARQLGVDAVVSVIQIQNIEQGWSVKHLTGDAPFAYTTSSSLMAYVPGHEEVVWQASNIKGKEVSSEKLKNAAKIMKLSQTGLESSVSSSENLSKTYVR